LARNSYRGKGGKSVSASEGKKKEKKGVAGYKEREKEKKGLNRREKKRLGSLARRGEKRDSCGLSPGQEGEPQGGPPYCP